MKRILALLGTAAILFPTSLFAQGALPATGEAMGGAQSDDVVYQKKTRYDFEDDHVEGVLLKPGEEEILGERHCSPRSLIEVRQDFVAEVLKSVEDI